MRRPEPITSGMNRFKTELILELDVNRNIKHSNTIFCMSYSILDGNYFNGRTIRIITDEFVVYFSGYFENGRGINGQTLRPEVAASLHSISSSR